MTSRLIDTLRAFNRKERYYVFRELVTNTDPCLSSDFADRLEKVIGVRPDPDACFLAVDYHLDWISAAVFLARSGKLKESGSLGGLVKTDRSEVFASQHCTQSPVMAGNQEDVDALLAFHQDGATHLVLIEAKADTAWSLTQLRSKGERLLKIFGQPDEKGQYEFDGENIVCHLVLLGPGEGDKNFPGTRKMNRKTRNRNSGSDSVEERFPSWFYSRRNDDNVWFNFVTLSSPSVKLFKPRRVSGKGDSFPWCVHSLSDKW